MTTNNTSPWKKSFVEVVDQRREKLPPAWLGTNKTVAQRSERGREVHESGRERIAANAVITLLQQAAETVVVSSFLLADKDIEDALLATAKRGVRVYVLLASEARLGKEDSEGEFDKKVLELHKQMLTRLGGHVLFRSAPHFHAKVVVVDPETSPAGILLTANLTTEALERNEELAIVLTSQEVVEATAYAKWAMWESAEHELVDPKDRFKAVKPLGKVPHPGLSSALVATTPKTTTVRDEALRLINGARSRIVVSSFGWDAEHEVVRRLAARAREGVDITVLARVRPSSMPALLALAEAGAKVVGFKWLHAKAIWTDSRQAMVMSANLQADGLDHGFEFGVRLSGSRADEVLARLTRWAEGAEWRLAAAPTLGDASGKVTLWQGGKLVDGEVRPSADVDLGTVTASSAHELMAQRPAAPNTGSLPRLAHELRCTWTVAAPLLAAKAKEVRRPIDGEEKPVSYTPPVFREPGDRLVVVVRSHDELEPARALMSEVSAAAIVLAEGGAR
jgi:cardiolipin synthase